MLFPLVRLEQHRRRRQCIRPRISRPRRTVMRTRTGSLVGHSHSRATRVRKKLTATPPYGLSNVLSDAGGGDCGEGGWLTLLTIAAMLARRGVLG